ncbi:TetR family transcriptional regulator [Sciscionella marina]|uniref:TetR family transcriptional regulator n=1 Tax=Sciscionella marina TaxID=508770 RepID=UPI0004777973|nr:TetR family transcriptional regulator [Sciscionella marina]
MPPDATATKRRILEAAYHEFARYGLAGARVDRMADAAQANKRLIYVHFGNKAELFDLIVARSLADLAEAVPFTAEDLPGYAGEVFDYLITYPEVVRLTGWAQLERPEPTEDEIAAYRPKVAAIQAARPALGSLESADPTDILALVLGLTTAWANASPALRALAPEKPWSPKRLRTHRTVIIAAVEAFVARQ